MTIRKEISRHDGVATEPKRAENSRHEENHQGDSETVRRTGKAGAKHL